MDERRKWKEKQWEERLKKLQAVEAWYQTYPLIPAYRPRLIDPSPFWHTVYRQKHAFQVAACHPEEVHVFAFEADSPTSDAADRRGQRKYVITNYLQLWHTVHHLAGRGKPPSFYEVIPEGSACKLYFDLEFSRGLNPEHNGVEMVQTFIEFVCAEMDVVYQISCNASRVLNLDATTEAKFSRHLIFNLSQTVFKDNGEAGNFVRYLCQKITKICQGTDSDLQNEDGEPDPKRKRHQVDQECGGAPDQRRQSQRESLQKLFVQDRDGRSVLFVDQGVYTRNRNFRLYKCVKLAKANPLEIADDNMYRAKVPRRSGSGQPQPQPQPPSQAALERQLFLDSIITNVSYCSGTRVLTMEPEAGQSKKKSNQPCNENSPHTKDCLSEQQEGFDHSPYPEVDAFVLSVITMDGIQGSIRRWVYFTQGQVLVYDIAKNRWCGNVQRQHKSNNIMILVDLRHGVYYQKCHDPDCRAAGYKSPDSLLPAHLLPTFGDDIDDDELLAAVTAAEDHESSLDHGPDGGGGRTGSRDSDQVDDDELLAASLRLENRNPEMLNAEHDIRQGAPSLEGSRSLPDTERRSGNADMTESDEELLAAVTNVENHSTSFMDPH